MKMMIEALRKCPQVSDYKINVCKKESYELFYVKGKLETVRRTDTCDKEVTVYVDHDGYKGDAQFFVYPSTTQEQMAELVQEAVVKARLIKNRNYELPGAQTGEFVVESNFAGHAFPDLAAKIAAAVFGANTIEHAELNAVEIFLNQYTETVVNSRGLHKTQIRYDAMVEAIPTYNGETQSVELYEQYNFSNLDEKEIYREIAGKMAEVKARYEAVKPETEIACKVILNPLELEDLFRNIAMDLNYGSIYAHASVFKKGEAIQKAPKGDRIGIFMKGEMPGNIRSAKFDQDGMTLRDIRIVENGMAINYYGSNRYGQYLEENPTGNLRCLCVDAGTTEAEAFCTGPYLEVVSMSGLQVDFYNDYIGGEVRLAYYHDGEKMVPVTGVSIAGKLGDVLNHMYLSKETAVYDGYMGPKQAILEQMKIF